MGTKILHLSDLHIDVNASILEVKRESLEKQLLKFLKDKKEEYDLVLISGDISNNMNYSLKILNKIEESTGKKVLFVPGNHDVVRDKTFRISSETLYNLYKESKYGLTGKPFKVTEDFYIVGGLGWYDYSFYEDYFEDMADEKYIRDMKQVFWYDGNNIDFKNSDKEIFEKELKIYLESLNKLRAEGKTVWVMNHFIPYRSHILFTNDSIWNQCNAFMGSSEFGEILDSFDNIKYVSFGHTHKRYGVSNRGDKTIVCNPLGYVGEWTNCGNTYLVGDSYVDVKPLIEDYYNELEEVHIIIEV